MPAQHKRPKKNQSKSNGIITPVWRSGGYCRQRRKTESMDIKKFNGANIQRIMDGRPGIHQDMGTPANLYPKVHEKILHTVKSIKTPPERTKIKKWNNYTKKEKTSL